MKKYLVVLILVCSGVVCPARAFAQAIDPAFEKEIVHLLEITGVQKTGEQMIGTFMVQFGQAMRQTNPNVPPRMFDIAAEVARGLFTNEFGSLLPRMVKAYASVLTRDEVRQLTVFYESPIGKRLVELTPALSQASSAASQAWVQELTPQLQAELQRRFKAEGLVP